METVLGLSVDAVAGGVVDSALGVVGVELARLVFEVVVRSSDRSVEKGDADAAVIRSCPLGVAIGGDGIDVVSELTFSLF